MMDDGSHDTPYMIREMSISGDIMAYRACPRQYRYYDVLGLPRSNKDPLWNSEFICGLEREAYHVWRTTGRPVRDRPSIGIMCRDVSGFLESRGMHPHPKAYEDDPDGTSGLLMNLRAHETVCFAMDHLFPLVRENDIVIRYRDGDMPFSMKGSAGIIDGGAVLDAGDDNILACMIKETVKDITADSEVLFEIRGTERPLYSDRDSGMDGHASYINALMGMRMSGTDHADVVAGVILYLNELRMSKRAMNALRVHLDEIDDVLDDDELDMLNDLEDGVQPSLESRIRRCIRVIPFDEVASRKAINDMHRVGMGIIRSHEADAGDPSNIAMHWEPGCYDSRRCRTCDFRPSCEGIPLGEKVVFPGSADREDNMNPSAMAPRD